MEKVLKSSEKLDFYRELKDNIFSEQKYLDILKNSNTRKIYIRLRISNYNLHIEAGRRYSRPKKSLERKNHLCHFCTTNSVEDEKHFLLSCNNYKIERKIFYSNLKSLIGDLPSNHKELARTIFCTENKDVIFQTAKFINLCFTKREQLPLPLQS